MSFNARMLQPIGGQGRSGNAAIMWAYTTTDNEATVNGAGYFGDQRFAMRIGDIIFRTTVDGSGAHVETGLHLVTTKTATMVQCITAVLQVSTGTGLPTTGGTLTGLLGLTTNFTITATGTNAATAFLIADQSNIITGGAANTGVILPDFDGAQIRIKNDTATDKFVYPFTGGTIDGAASLTLPAGLNTTFVQKGTAVCTF